MYVIKGVTKLEDLIGSVLVERKRRNKEIKKRDRKSLLRASSLQLLFLQSEIEHNEIQRKFDGKSGILRKKRV